MSDSAPDRDDMASVSAVAIIAMILVTFAHEAAGHGVACWMAGGRITQLTSVYFDCSEMTGPVALGGPIGNIAAALLAWLTLRMLPPAARARLLALVVMAFSLFWAAGYLIYAMVKGHGDYALAAHTFFPTSPQLWRPAGILLGAVLYGISIRLVRYTAEDSLGARAARVLPMAWIAATIAAVLAAALYAPNPGDAMVQAALEIGAASVPLLLFARRNTGTSGAAAITRNTGWLAAAIVLFLGFAATLGRGIV
ncbi:MAG TPA: hypothetical protein VLL04_03655 [Rhizomicrobium sp.]|nr:hypothetical protein [Rhizomicrobium sp.]